MPLSYAQYAGNGSTTTFSVPFPYLLKAHVKLYTGFNIINGAYTSLLVDGTDYSWASSTQVQLTVAPANGVTLTVIRDTPDSSQLVPWQDGSNLTADELNSADLQNLYVVQEQQDRNDAGITQSTAAATAANAATTTANTATSTANAATSTANTALSTANTALSTANTASSNASAAVSTANTASSNASAAVTTANAASATANTASTNASNAVTTANAASAAAASATTTANTAASNASTALSTANTASSNAAAAVSTANTASTNASNAVSTANTASSNASSALTAANNAVDEATDATAFATAANANALEAVAVANAAAGAVANAVLYDVVANVAAIPGSPSNNDAVEVTDSTGIQSFTPLAGVPAGFVGDAGLSVRIIYNSTGATWSWIQYYPNDPETRYLAQTGGTLTGQLLGDNSTSAATPAYAFDGDANTGVGRTGVDELALITGGVARLTADAAGNIDVPGALSKSGDAVVVTTDSRLSDTRTPTDGSVTNAKVSAGAAIDKTKISGTAITAADTGTVTSTMIADGTIVNADISATAAIANSKLATSGVTAGTYGSSSLIPAITVNDKGIVTSASTNSLPAGIVTTADTGTVTSTMLANGTIVDADISATAAIAGTKVSPDFGSQNVTTTGTATASGFSGSGASLTALNASNLSSGTIPDARFPATLPAVSGANLTGIAAFPAGTVMLFAQTAAPTGWTKSTTHDNKALRVVSGTASSGGTTAFTSVFASRTPSGTIANTTATGTVGATTLSTAQMPSHSHTIARSTNLNNSSDTALATSGVSGVVTTSAAGGGGSHDHSLTMNAHNHTFTGTALDFAVQYVDVILATKS